ncbi:MAG: hypothetical protein M3552_10440 [Planctomycetota bacterium]|nr:hypothetical protein [Planctomycetaceae bacterium]MDQ3331056.1 hypothetical protein [Planctomycetota bacterium]
MTRPLVRKLGAPFALAYLLAGWLAAALHSHAGHDHSHVAADHAGACTTCQCGHDHGPSNTQQGAEESPAEPEDGAHHCVVCDNLAKPPLPVVAVVLEAAIEPAVAAAEPIAPLYDARVAPARHSRGPPLV